MTHPPLISISVPPGKWVLGVSGGADSVALLRIVTKLPGVRAIVAHLNHQTRGPDSDADAEFVLGLSDSLGVESVIVSRDQLDNESVDELKNRQSRFRKLRQLLFARTVRDHGAAGVLTAHHADDQAETVILRLLRSGEPTALAGIARQAIIRADKCSEPVLYLRPMLEIRRAEIWKYLSEIKQPWRDDGSNESMKYARNRIRKMLAGHPEVTDAALAVADAAARLRAVVQARQPVLGESFGVDQVADLPDIVARHAIRRWLVSGGVDIADCPPAVVARLIEMTRDAASPARLNVAGGASVVRRRRALRLVR